MTTKRSPKPSHKDDKSDGEFAGLAKALFRTPEAQAMIRKSGAKTIDDYTGGQRLLRPSVDYRSTNA